MSRFIDLTPTWREAATIIAAALENGTGKGREAARDELFRMATILDQIHTNAKASTAPYVEGMPVYLVAKRTTDKDGQPITVYWRAGDIWTSDVWDACFIPERADADREADQWSDYWHSKGFARRAHVARFTLADLDEAETSTEAST